MVPNPFTPLFGGRPGFFFGRKSILSRFDFAMADNGSEDRALFITGTRGSGKTTLLEQLSLRARNHYRTVIDLGPDDTVAQLMRSLISYDEKTTTVSPQASVSFMGVGGGVSAGSISKTTHYGRESLQAMLLDACERSRGGMLITIDEIQKVPIDDTSAICNAFQMASRKGHDIMLAVAGLPYAHRELIQHEGCTYLRRAAHEEIGLFSWEEANEALADAFGQIDGIVVTQRLRDMLNEASYGHPYLMQLLGYYLVNGINSVEGSSPGTITDIANQTVPLAINTYERRALKPLIDELSEGEVAYLRAMSRSLNDDRLASSGDVARLMGKSSNQLSSTRAHLIDKGIVASPEHGKLMFCIPYLAAYLLKEPIDSLSVARERRV